MVVTDITACAFCPVPLLPGDEAGVVLSSVVHREHLPGLPTPVEELEPEYV